MEPGSEFWASVGQSVAHSSGEWVVGVAGIVALAFVVGKYVLPVWRDAKRAASEIDKRRLELDVKSQADEDAQARDRIRLTERQLEIQAGQTRAIEALTAQTTALNAALDTSRANSAHMGERVSVIDERTARIEAGVVEIMDIAKSRD